MQRKSWFLAGSLAALVSILGEAAEPKIELDKLEHDFGKVTDATELKGVFVVKNTGDAPLKLDKPTTTCGCTVANVKPDTLQPGEQGELSFTLQVPNGRMAVNKQIFVTSNDPKTPRVTLSVKVDHQPLYDFTPASLNLVLRKNTSTNIAIQVHRSDGQKLNLPKIEVNQKWVTTKLELTEKGDSGQILVTVQADDSTKRLSDFIRVYDENTNKPVTTIWINARVIGDVMWNPESLVWSINDPARTRERKEDYLITRKLIVTSSVPGAGLAITNLKSTLDIVDLQVVPATKESGTTIVAKLKEIPDKTLSGQLTFETGVPSQAAVQVPIVVSVTPPAPTRLPAPPPPRVATPPPAAH